MNNNPTSDSRHVGKLDPMPDNITQRNNFQRLEIISIGNESCASNREVSNTMFNSQARPYPTSNQLTRRDKTKQ